MFLYGLHRVHVTLPWYGYVKCTYVHKHTKIVRNVHTHMPRNPKNTKHLRLFFASGTKLFITFLSLRFFDMKRETQFLSMLTFPSNYTTCGTPSKTIGLASVSFQNRLPFSSVESQLTAFFSNPQILSLSLPRMTPFTSPGFLLWHLWLSHPPCARVNTCTQCVDLTYPCTKPKGFQPN